MLFSVKTRCISVLVSNRSVLGDPHAREMLLSFPAACDAYCSLTAATLYRCSAAQVQLVVLCNHWVRLHCCT